MFGGGGGGGRGERGPRGKAKGEDVVFPLKVTLEDLYNSTSKKLRLTKSVICVQCAGKGGKGEATCRECKGHGVKLVIRQLGPGMIQQMQAACGACKGTGNVMAEKDKCKKCGGEKVTKEKKTLEVFITKGMRHSEKIVFNGEADEAVSGHTTHTAHTHTHTRAQHSAQWRVSLAINRFVQSNQPVVGA